MSGDADVVHEALEHLRSCTYSLVLLLKNVDVELRDEIMRHIDAVPEAHEALDRLVARLAELERRVDEERKRADGELRTAIAHERRLAEVERDRNLFRDTLAIANEHVALLEEALRAAKTFYDSEYPQIAGQVIAMQHSGETVAEASWLRTANALHALGQTLKEALSGARGGEEQRT